MLNARCWEGDVLYVTVHRQHISIPLMGGKRKLTHEEWFYRDSKQTQAHFFMKSDDTEVGKNAIYRPYNLRV